MAQAYTRLCSGNETMKTLYAAHEVLKARGLHGKPRERVPEVEEGAEELSDDASDGVLAEHLSNAVMAVRPWTSGLHLSAHCGWRSYGKLSLTLGVEM